MQRSVPSEQSHRRSLSFCHYEEFMRTNERAGTPVKRKGFKIESDPSENADECQLLTSDGDFRGDEHNQNQLSESKVTSTSNSDLAHVDVQSPINALLTNHGSTCFLSFNQIDQQTSKQDETIVKGHRRSLSLKQHLEVGYNLIVSEFEHARDIAGKTVTHATETVWKVCHYSNLPKWMQDNEYLHFGHRPPLPSFWECAKSIFRIHTETGNIWTHGLGMLIFVCLFIYQFVTISANKSVVDRWMLAIYFFGIILCLFFSTIFHTFSCYSSPKVIKIFSKLDYCGISLQIIGSMVPALYYGFYKDLYLFKIYISFGIILCILSIIVSMWDKFGEPKYRSFRAMVFLTFGLSNVIPGIHWYIILDSRLFRAYYLFILQGALYVVGSLLYANRIPERFFPGKCDYMFQSHQIFHVLVVLAALVHLNGINQMAEFHLNPSQTLVTPVSLV